MLPAVFFVAVLASPICILAFVAMLLFSHRDVCHCLKALEDVMQSIAAIQSELHVDRVDICTTTELELD